MRTIRSALISALLLALLIALPVYAGISNFDNIVVTSDVVIGDDITQALGNENVGMLPTIQTVAVTYESDGAIFTIADGEVWIVHDILVDVGTNFDCTGDNCTLTIGDGNDADGFIVLADAQMQAADTEGAGFAAGWQGMSESTRGVYFDEATNASAHNFVYAPSGSAETIDIAIGGTSPAAGAATVYIVYTRIQ